MKPAQSPEIKFTALKLPLEKLYIKLEWSTETGRQMSTWLAFNILRTFLYWYLTTNINVTLSGSCYVLGVLPVFHVDCSYSLNVYSKTGAYFVCNRDGSLSPYSGILILSSYKSFLHQRQQQHGMRLCSVLGKGWRRKKNAHWSSYLTVHDVLVIVAHRTAHLHGDLPIKGK